jgi:hypothetical protein
MVDFGFWDGLGRPLGRLGTCLIVNVYGHWDGGTASRPMVGGWLKSRNLESRKQKAKHGKTGSARSLALLILLSAGGPSARSKPIRVNCGSSQFPTSRSLRSLRLMIGCVPRSTRVMPRFCGLLHPVAPVLCVAGGKPAKSTMFMRVVALLHLEMPPAGGREAAG